MQVKWSKKALLNLSAAVKYIAADKPGAARDAAQRIWDVAKLLAEQPDMGRTGRVKGTRELIVTGLPFILPYVIHEDSVIILRVMHTSMKWPEHF